MGQRTRDKPTEILSHIFSFLYDVLSRSSRYRFTDRGYETFRLNGLVKERCAKVTTQAIQLLVLVTGQQNNWNATTVVLPYMPQ